MSGAWIVTLAPVFGLAGDVVAQIALAHVARRVGVAIVGGALAGLGVTVASTVLSRAAIGSPGDVASTWIVALATYAALAFGYWAFVSLNITSLRIRMLREILHSRAGISRQRLMAEYSADEFLRRRLERLRNGGQISFHQERWRLESRTLLRAAQILDATRAVLLPSRAREEND